jgi:hypothetical protein
MTEHGGRQDVGLPTPTRTSPFDAVSQRRARQASRAPLRWVEVQPQHLVDVFVYVVVLNLAIEYLPAVISESFTLSLLTAVLLKLALELVILLKERLVARFRGATRFRGKLLAGLSLWLVAAGSKIVVLELVNVAFRDAVSLGGFVSVTLLVVTLLLARAAVRHVLPQGTDGSPAPDVSRSAEPRRLRDG